MTPREASIDWVRRALADELHEISPLTKTRAENLVAVAELHHVRVEELLQWIHTPAQGKQYSAAEFGRFCERLGRMQ